VDTASQESKGFNHPLYVRIFALVRLEQEPGSDLGIFLGKLASQLAQEGQLSLVISQELVAHQSPFKVK
jgi:hypothetical protein